MKTTFTILLGFLLSVLFISFEGCKCYPEISGNVPNTLRPQETNNWCWAATTQMLSENLGIVVTQCDLANHRFGKANCCDFETAGVSCPKTSDCNTPGWLELDYAGVKFSETSTALSWEDLRKQIYCSKKPMGYAYGTSGVVGHVLVIKGYITLAGTNYLILNDPWAPCAGAERIITYEEYADPAGTSTHWNTWYNIAKK
jgi:hypothetical protein